MNRDRHMTGRSLGRKSRSENLVHCKTFYFATRCRLGNIRRGFTLIEVVICLIIVLAAGIGTVAGITYTRLNLELEKQRLAGLNYCRQAMEAIQSLDTAQSGVKRLVPFNSPGIEDLDATLTVSYFDMNEDGSVDFSSPRTGPAINKPVYARVAVSWVPYGSKARPQEVNMSTIVTRGLD